LLLSTYLVVGYIGVVDVRGIGVVVFLFFSLMFGRLIVVLVKVLNCGLHHVMRLQYCGCGPQRNRIGPQ
jgi:hypothetical protein